MPSHPSRQSPSEVRVNGETQGAHRVLVVDDDINLTRLLRAILRTSGLDVTTASTGPEALSLAVAQVFHLIVLDLRLPGMDGRTVFRELRARGVNTPVLIASAFGARSAQLELGAQGSIEKPFDPEWLLEAVDKILEKESPADDA